MCGNETAEQQSADFLLQRVADELVERLSAVTRRFATALDLGTPSSLLADRLAASGLADRVIRMDRLVEALPPGMPDRFVGDEEALPIADFDRNAIQGLIDAGMTRLQAAVTSQEHDRIQHELDGWRNLLIEAASVRETAH